MDTWAQIANLRQHKGTENYLESADFLRYQTYGIP